MMGELPVQRCPVDGTKLSRKWVFCFRFVSAERMPSRVSRIKIPIHGDLWEKQRFAESCHVLLRVHMLRASCKEGFHLTQVPEEDI